MRFRFPILVLLAACAPKRAAPPPPAAVDAGCVTTCGLRTADGDCAELRAFEPEVIRAVGSLPKMDPEDVCAAVHGWRIKLHVRTAYDTDMCGDLSWWLAPGFCIAGYTWKDDRTIELATTNWRHNALTHEVVHVADLKRTGGRPGHCLWKYPQVGETLEHLTGRHENQKPEADCSR
jgi:hypothetical protein